MNTINILNLITNHKELMPQILRIEKAIYESFQNITEKLDLTDNTNNSIKEFSSLSLQINKMLLESPTLRSSMFDALKPESNIKMSDELAQITAKRADLSQEFGTILEEIRQSLDALSTPFMFALMYTIGNSKRALLDINYFEIASGVPKVKDIMDEFVNLGANCILELAKENPAYNYATLLEIQNQVFNSMLDTLLPNDNDDAIKLLTKNNLNSLNDKISEKLTSKLAETYSGYNWIMQLLTLSLCREEPGLQKQSQELGDVNAQQVDAAKTQIKGLISGVQTIFSDTKFDQVAIPNTNHH